MENCFQEELEALEAPRLLSTEAALLPPLSCLLVVVQFLTMRNRDQPVFKVKWSPLIDTPYHQELSNQRLSV